VTCGLPVLTGSSAVGMPVGIVHVANDSAFGGLIVVCCS
jgi:hypothetical protein